MFGRGQRGGKFRLPLPEELAHDCPIITGALGLYGRHRTHHSSLELPVPGGRPRKRPASPGLIRNDP